MIIYHSIKRKTNYSHYRSIPHVFSRQYRDTPIDHPPPKIANPPKTPFLKSPLNPQTQNSLTAQSSNILKPSYPSSTRSASHYRLILFFLPPRKTKPNQPPQCHNGSLVSSAFMCSPLSHAPSIIPPRAHGVLTHYQPFPNPSNPLYHRGTPFHPCLSTTQIIVFSPAIDDAIMPHRSMQTLINNLTFKLLLNLFVYY